MRVGDPVRRFKVTPERPPIPEGVKAAELERQSRQEEAPQAVPQLQPAPVRG